MRPGLDGLDRRLLPQPGRRRRRRRRDAFLVPRVRLLRHLLPRAPRRPRRAEAGAAADPLHDERHGPAARPRSRQERPGRRRGDGQTPPPRRRRHLRRPGADGAALRDAAAHRRRARQLGFSGRLCGGDALHRVPDGAAGGGDDRRHPRGHRRLPAQLRLPRDGAQRPAGGHPPPARQRQHRHRGRDGHQHRAAQPGRGGPGASPRHQASRRHGRRPDAVHPRPRPADRWQDRRPRGGPRRLRDRARQLPDACHGPHRDDRPPQGHRGHRAPLRRGHREGRRADQDARAGQEAAGHRRHQGPHRPRQGSAAGHRGQERLRPRSAARAALSADADGGLLRHQHRRPGRRAAAHPGPARGAARLPRPPLRGRPPPLGVPSGQGGRPAAPRPRSARGHPRHRRGHPADPDQRQHGSGQGTADRRLRPDRGPGRLHPRDAAAPAHQVLPSRAGEGAGRARADHRGARRDHRRRAAALEGRLRRAGRGRQDLRHAAAYGPARVFRYGRHRRRPPRSRSPTTRASPTSPPPACWPGRPPTSSPARAGVGPTTTSSCRWCAPPSGATWGC